MRRDDDLGLGEQVVRRLAHGRGGHVDLVVAAQIHEDVVLAVEVEVLHRTLVDAGRLDLGAGVEGAVHDLAGEDVLQCRADERSALARLDVLELDDGPQLSVEIEHQAVLEVVGRGHNGRVYCPVRRWPAARLRSAPRC
jgi:hypothetical protein